MLVFIAQLELFHIEENYFFSTDEDARQAMRLDGGKVKEVQVHLLLSSRAEMQKVIETARSTTSAFAGITVPQPVQQPMQTSMQQQSMQPSIQQQPQMPQILDQKIKNAHVSPSQPVTLAQTLPLTQNFAMLQSQLLSNQTQQGSATQNPLLTSNSLSGILAQQMYQQHQMQMMSQQQNMPLMTSTSVRHDNYSSTQAKPYATMNPIPMENVIESKESLNNQKLGLIDPYMKRREEELNLKKRSSRSRSRSRERRDRRDRRRSRSRDRGDRSDRSDRRTRHRDRSRSRDRRRRRSREHSRDRSGRDKDRSKRSLEKEERVPGKSFESVKSPDSYRSGSENVDEKKSSLTNLWGNGANQQQPVGILQNFSSFNVPGMKPGANLFQNMYNQPTGNDQPSNQSSSTTDEKRPVSSFEPVMPMLPYGNSYKNDRSANSRSAPSEKENQSCCLRVKNIGTETHYSVLRRFFSGYHIPNDGIKLLNDQYGNRIGEAVVRFQRPEVARAALAKDRTMLNKNMVSCKSISADEYDEEVDSYKPPRGGGFRDQGGFRSGRGGRDGRDEDDYRRYNRGNRFDDDRRRFDDDNRDRFNVGNDNFDNNYISSRDTTKYSTLIIEGLPVETTLDDIKLLFSNYPVVQIIFPKDSNDIHAYVKLQGPEDAQKAVNDAFRIGYKPVFVSTCSDDIFARVAKENKVDVIDGSRKSDPKVINERPIEIHDDEDDDDENDGNGGTGDRGRNVDDDSEENDNSKEMNLNKNELNRSAENTGSMNLGNLSGGKPSGIPSLFDVNIERPNDSVGGAESPPSNFMQGLSSVNTSDPRLNREVGFGGGNVATMTPPAFGMNANISGPGPGMGNMLPSQMGNNSNRNNISGDEKNCVFISNMEYKISEKEVRDWLGTIGLNPKLVYFLKNNRGQSTGSSYCIFDTPGEARRALVKNRLRFNSRTVFVNQIPMERVRQEFPEVDKDLNQGNDDDMAVDDDNDDDNKDDDNDDDENDENRDDNENKNEIEKNIVVNEPKDVKRNEDDIKVVEKKTESPEKPTHKNPFKQKSSVSEERTVQESEPPNNDKSNSNFGGGNMNMMGSGGQMGAGGQMGSGGPMGSSGHMGARGLMDSDIMSRGSIGDNQMGYMNMQSNNMMNSQQDSGDGGSGGGGHYNNNMNFIIELRNVPFKATVEDILQFFNGFPLTPNHVIRRYNDDGTPTGDARVCFNSLVQARKAMERNRCHIMGRPIFLMALR